MSYRGLPSLFFRAELRTQEKGQFFEKRSPNFTENSVRVLRLGTFNDRDVLAEVVIVVE